VTVYWLAEKKAGQQRGDERGGAEHKQHVGDRREAERKDEADETSGKQDGAREQRQAGVADIDQHATALQQK